MASKSKIAGNTIKVFLKDPGLFMSLITNAAKVAFMHIRFFITGKKLTIISLTEHIGDLVAAEPLVNVTKQQFPGNYIIWVVDRRYTVLLKNNPAINQLITVTSFTEWILLKSLIPSKNLHDLHIDGKVCGKHAFQYKRDPSIGINVSNFFEQGNLLHAFSLSGSIPIDDTTAPRLHMDKDFPVPASPYIVIHTTSNNPLRDLSVNTWNDMAAYIVDHYPQVKIIELGFQPQITMSTPAYLDETSTRDLSYVAALIRHCTFYIGIDSGFAHMANALEKDALIFIGNYLNFKKYMPYSGKYQKEKEQHIYYFDGALKDLKLSDIQNRLDQKLSPLQSKQQTS